MTIDAGQMPFTGMELDRASTERKDADWIERVLADPSTRAIAADHDGVLAGEAALRRLPALATAEPGEAIVLGLDGETALLALDLEDLDASDRARVAGDAEHVSLREAGLRLQPAEAGLAAYTVALLNWHRSHRFCANCGAATTIEEGGHSRICPACGAHHFPRTDPCVIMTVADGDRLLLGRRAGWPTRRLSVLAGFVSPGESVEEAVLREVEEESGIRARDPAFIASQPWPFPASLMLGFHAVADGGEPRATDGELDEVAWFDRGDVRRALAGEDVGFQLAPGVSIARFLIERWAQGAFDALA